MLVCKGNDSNASAPKKNFSRFSHLCGPHFTVFFLRCPLARMRNFLRAKICRGVNSISGRSCSNSGILRKTEQIAINPRKLGLPVPCSNRSTNRLEVPERAASSSCDQFIDRRSAAMRLPISARTSVSVSVNVNFITTHIWRIIPFYLALFAIRGEYYMWSRAFRLGVSGAEAPSSNRACGFPAHGFPCETGVIGISFL